MNTTIVAQPIPAVTIRPTAPTENDFGIGARLYRQGFSNSRGVYDVFNVPYNAYGDGVR